MEKLILGKVITTLGTLFIAYAALRVHHRVLEEHKMDKKVFLSMKREQVIGVVGVALVVVGTCIEVFGLLG